MQSEEKPTRSCRESRRAPCRLASLSAGSDLLASFNLSCSAAQGRKAAREGDPREDEVSDPFQSQGLWSTWGKASARPQALNSLARPARTEEER